MIKIFAKLYVLKRVPLRIKVLSVYRYRALWVSLDPSESQQNVTFMKNNISYQSTNMNKNFKCI